MTRVRNSTLREERTTVVTDSEFAEVMRKATEIRDIFLRLRARAILCLFRLTGKRRGELAMLPLENFRIQGNYLTVTFILEKKRKDILLSKTSDKSIPLTDPLTRPILEYLEYLHRLEPKPKYFLPRVKSLFGNNFIMLEHHISGRQVFNVVRKLSGSLWPHLFRETAACDVIKSDSSIMGAFKVQRRLDLEDFRTGFSYLRRFAADVIEREQGTKQDIIKRQAQ
jgi:integrase